MNKAFQRSAVLLGVASVLFLSACSNDDEPETVTQTVTATATVTATPEPSATPTGKDAATDEVHLKCPDPVGEVDALTDGEDEWGPAYVVDSDVVLEPVAFGEVSGTTSDGSTFTDSAKTKPDASKDDALECTFTMSIVNEEITADIEGTVWVLVK